MRDVFGVLSILLMSGAVEDTSTNLTISIEIIQYHQTIDLIKSFREIIEQSESGYKSSKNKIGQQAKNQQETWKHIG